MENEFVKLFYKYESCIELGMLIDIRAFLEERDDIKEYVLKVNGSETILLNIKLNKFSKLSAKNLFKEFISFVGYSGINLYICKDKVSEIKYLYLTVASSDSIGAKMEVEIG